LVLATIFLGISFISSSSSSSPLEILPVVKRRFFFPRLFSDSPLTRFLAPGTTPSTSLAHFIAASLCSSVVRATSTFSSLVSGSVRFLPDMELLEAIFAANPSDASGIEYLKNQSQILHVEFCFVFVMLYSC
jgi:hypothetical protein